MRRGGAKSTRQTGSHGRAQGRPPRKASARTRRRDCPASHNGESAKRCSVGRCGVVRPDDETRAQTVPGQVGSGWRRARWQPVAAREASTKRREAAVVAARAWARASQTISVERAGERAEGAGAQHRRDRGGPNMAAGCQFDGPRPSGKRGGRGSRRRRQQSPCARCVTPARQIGRVRVWPPSRGGSVDDGCAPPYLTSTATRGR